MTFKDSADLKLFDMSPRKMISKGHGQYLNEDRREAAPFLCHSLGISWEGAGGGPAMTFVFLNRIRKGKPPTWDSCKCSRGQGGLGGDDREVYLHCCTPKFEVHSQVATGQGRTPVSRDHIPLETISPKDN